MALKKISAQEVIQEYKKGRRDFSSIDCRDADFGNINFPGAVFSGSDLSFASFRNSDLTDCNFSGCVLDWSTFVWAKLIRTNFTNAKLRWCCLNDATFEKTILRKADISWSVVLNTKFFDSDLEGADFTTAIFHESQFDPEKAQTMLNQLRGRIPYDLLLTIQFSINTTRDRTRLLNLSMQQNTGTIGYKSGVSGYQINSGGTEEVKYTVGKDYSVGKKYESKKGYNK